MKAKTFFKALSIKAKQRGFMRTGFARSYVSLFLVLILGVSSTLAWFTERQAAQLNSENLEFQSASSLRINKDKTSANKITIPAFTLDEASSLDGRNIYFPVGESFTSNTAEMFFREGNRGDENVHYVYKDFELKGTSGLTPVYIKSYKIQVGNDVFEDELKVVDSNGHPISEGKVPDHQVKPSDHCPVRLAFIADSGVKPVVIDPSAQVSPTTEFRHGTYIAAGAVVSVGTDIGKFVIVNARSGVGHDSTVGDFSNICPGVSLSGHTVLGKGVMMGTNSCTAPGVKIGDGASVACGTPVYSDLKAGETLSPFGVLKSGLS